MKLTGWFSQDKIADNSRVQTPNNANTEQVNRQIRALVPGQTLRGEVVSREGNNAQIRLLQDVLIKIRCSRSGMKVMRSRMRRFWIS